MDAHDIATLISLAMTIPALFGCLGVVWLWHESAWRAWKSEHKTETHWFILGVTVAFAGSFIDNTYWALAWYADFYELPSRDALFHHGVYSNTIFRQGCTAFAAYCHIRAAVVSTSLQFRLWITFSWLLGS